MCMGVWLYKTHDLRLYLLYVNMKMFIYTGLRNIQAVSVIIPSLVKFLSCVPIHTCCFIIHLHEVLSAHVRIGVGCGYELHIDKTYVHV